MDLYTVQEIERAIDALTPPELADLYVWLDSHRPQNAARPGVTVFEQGLDVFGSPDDAELLDDVICIAYEERRRPLRPSSTL